MDNNRINDDHTFALLGEAIRADQASKAARRALPSTLTVGQVEDHLAELTDLAADVRGYEYDRESQAADAIEEIRDHLERIL